MATRSTKRPRRSQVRDRQARPSSESFCDERTDTRGIGVAGRAANFLGALEDDQRALVLNAKVPKRLLCRVEIDLVDHEIRRFLLDLFDDWALPHHGAATSTRIVLPAAWACLKDWSSNGCAAWPTTEKVSRTAAASTHRVSPSRTCKARRVSVVRILECMVCLFPPHPRREHNGPRDTTFVAGSEKVTFDVKYSGLRPQNAADEYGMGARLAA